MKAVAIKEARQNLSGAIRRTESEHSTIIARHDRPAAKVVPFFPERIDFPDQSEFRNSIRRRGKILTNTLYWMRRKEKY